MTVPLDREMTALLIAILAQGSIKYRDEETGEAFEMSPRAIIHASRVLMDEGYLPEEPPPEVLAAKDPAQAIVDMTTAAAIRWCTAHRAAKGLP